MPLRKAKVKSSVSIAPKASRINKVLAAAGLGSRRQVEKLIVQGRVEIGGQTVTDLSSRVDPKTAKIKVDGEMLKRPKLVYYVLNKPKGVVSTNNDPSGRPRVVDFVPDRHRVFSVGRLDLHSEGLVLLTNDGTLAQRLAHPRFRVRKTYFVVVAGVMTVEELNHLRKGVYLAEGVARIDGARIRKTRKTCTELEIQLSEGKNREIRRILARAGHKVVLLRRISIGPLRLGELPVGAARELSEKEVQSLYNCTSSSQKKSVESSDQSGLSRKGVSRSRSPFCNDSTARRRLPSKEQPALYAGNITTPLELPVTDDFGIGLEDDFTSTAANAPAEFEFDEQSLNTGTEDFNADIDVADEDDWDDDFNTDFSLSSRTGSVIADDEDDEDCELQGSRGKSRRGASAKKGNQPKGRAKNAASRGKASSSQKRGGSRKSISPSKSGAVIKTTSRGPAVGRRRPASNRSRGSSTRRSSNRTSGKKRSR